jgi:hypothetical protein
MEALFQTLKTGSEILGQEFQSLKCLENVEVSVSPLSYEFSLCGEGHGQNEFFKQKMYRPQVKPPLPWI